jgi:excisionase family DNA binding protein
MARNIKRKGGNMASSTVAGTLNTVAGTADKLALKQPTIRAWLADGRIGFVRLGKSIRIPQAEIDRLIAEGTTPVRSRKRK